VHPGFAADPAVPTWWPTSSPDHSAPLGPPLPAILAVRASPQQERDPRLPVAVCAPGFAEPPVGRPPRLEPAARLGGHRATPPPHPLGVAVSGDLTRTRLPRRSATLAHRRPRPRPTPLGPAGLPARPGCAMLLRADTARSSGLYHFVQSVLE